MSSKNPKQKSSKPAITELEDQTNGSEEADTDEEDTFRDPPDGQVHLRPSIASPHIPSTVFVEYPPGLKMTRNDTGYVEDLGQRKLGYKSHWERICIRNAFVRAGFKKSSKYWTALMSKHQNSSQLEELSCLQKVNHFPSSWCIGRKDRLSRTLNAMKRLRGNDLFDFHPDTYIMPSDLDQFVRVLKMEIQAAITGRKKVEGFWIMKPVASSCGRGISVVTSSQALALLTSTSKSKKAAAAKTMLFQKYLDNPLLINKKKFDLRIYVLVTGVDPLRVYIHKEGLTRISTSNFSLKNIKNRFAHLTNYSVNKKNSVFKAASYEPAPGNLQQTPVSTSSKGNSTVPTNGVTTSNIDGEVSDADEEDNNEDVDEAQTEPHSSGAAGIGNDINNPEMEGYKWSLHAFKTWLSSQYSPQIMQETFQNIYDIIIKTMVAMEGEITPLIQRSGVNYRTNCFELFGCDVILDENLKPHLLEVNISPSLMGSSPLDKRIKGMLIADVLHTVGIYPFDPVLLRKYDGIRTADDNDSTMMTVTTASTRRKSLSSAVPVNHNKDANSRKTDGGDKSTNSSNNNVASNPFAFSNLSRLMSSQESYRRNPCSENIDLAALAAQAASTAGSAADGNSPTVTGNSNWWQILVLIEDEMHRAKSGGFIQVHPLIPSRMSSLRGGGGGGSEQQTQQQLVADLSSPIPFPGDYYLSLYRNPRFHDHLLYKWMTLGGCRGKAGQKYLPRYIFTHIRNNLETLQETYAIVGQVGTALFFDPKQQGAQNSNNSDMRRMKSGSRPSSASILSSSHRPHSHNNTNNKNMTNGSVVPALMVATTTTMTLTASPSGQHLLPQRVVAHTPIGYNSNTTTTTYNNGNSHNYGHSAASSSSSDTSDMVVLSPNIPVSARPSSRSRSFVQTTSPGRLAAANAMASVSPIQNVSHITALAHDYYSRMALNHHHTQQQPSSSSTSASISSQPTVESDRPMMETAALSLKLRDGLKLDMSNTTNSVGRAGNDNYNNNTGQPSPLTMNKGRCSSALSSPTASLSPKSRVILSNVSTTVPSPARSLASTSPFPSIDDELSQPVGGGTGGNNTAVHGNMLPRPKSSSSSLKVFKGRDESDDEDQQQEQQRSTRYQVVSDAVNTAAMAFAHAYSRPSDAVGVAYDGDSPPQPYDYYTGGTNTESGGTATATSSAPTTVKRRSISAPSTSRQQSTERRKSGILVGGEDSADRFVETSTSSRIADKSRHQHPQQQVVVDNSSSNGTAGSSKVLDILRKRRVDRQSQQSQLSQLRDYEERLALQIYQQQEQYALKQRQAQQFEQQQHLQQMQQMQQQQVPVSTGRIKELSQTHQLTSKQQQVSSQQSHLNNHNMPSALVGRQANSTAAVSVPRAPTHNPKKDGTGPSAPSTTAAASSKLTSSSPLAKHLQWQQQMMTMMSGHEATKYK